MKKIMVALAAGLIAAASFACCNCGKPTNNQNPACTCCVSTNCVCVCHNGQACTTEGCACDCHRGCVCGCHRPRKPCSCCCCGGCRPERRDCGCCKEFSCGNSFFGVRVSVSSMNPPPPPPARPQMPCPPPSTAQPYCQQPQTQPPPAQAMVPPVNGQPMQIIPTYRTWVEGRYMQGRLMDGRVVNTWIPGHYEECVLMNP